MKMYIKRFTQRLTTQIDGFEMPCQLPDMPPQKEMVNYGLPIHQQKFYRTEVPHDIRTWENKKEEAFVSAEWHKRLNGVWFLIKGKPVYITGPAYVYFNYWLMESGELPIFRMEAVEYFQVWDMALRDKACLGLLDIKCRRVGDTEKALFCGWEICTRIRASNFGMQNITDTDAFDNFQRLVMSARAMVYFFKPVPFESDMPQEALVYKFPRQRVTNKNRENANYTYAEMKKELRSKIDYKATVLRAYDGKKLRYYHLDEPGKVDPKRMNVYHQWEIVKICLQSPGGVLVGKGVLTTTIEHFKDGEAVTILAEFWNKSDPAAKNDNNQTTSGLWRIFRGYKLAAKEDEWGFHKVDEITEWRNATIRDLQKKRLFDEITNFKRKFPANIQEALVPPEDDCILSPYLIDEQINEISLRTDAGDHWPTRAVKGNLEWKFGFGSEVVWVPSEHGRWLISGHPPVKNLIQRRGGLPFPGNTVHFAGGCDPIDHMQPKTNASNGAIAIAAIPDMLRENQSLFVRDEHGNITNTDVMITNRCVCTYAYRHENPYDYYADVLKTCLYYGCQVNIETQKPGLIAWLSEKGYMGYLSVRPVLTDSKGMTKQNRRQTSNIGMHANTETILSYVEAIKQHNISYIGTHTHLDLLKDMRQYNGKKDNRTKRDLTVAWGHALTLANSVAYLTEKTNKKTEQWGAPFRNYN